MYGLSTRNEISIVQNEPLARSIYRTTKVNQQVPSELYPAIAEVLAYVYKIKRERDPKTAPEMAALFLYHW